MLPSSEFRQMVQEKRVGDWLGRHTPQNRRFKRVYLFETRVAGFQYHEGKNPEVAALLKPGVELVLVREPENKYDEKAVAIYTKQGNHVGYIPRDENHIPAAMADQDLFIGAEIIRFRADLVLIAPWECLQVRVFQSMPKARKSPFLSLICPRCGGPMHFEAGAPTIKCPYCGVEHILLGIK